MFHYSFKHRFLKRYRYSICIVFYKLNIVYIVSYYKLYDGWIVYIIMAYDLIVFYVLYVYFHPVYYFVLINGFFIQDTFKISKYVSFLLCHNYTKYIFNNNPDKTESNLFLFSL